MKSVRVRLLLLLASICCIVPDAWALRYERIGPLKRKAFEQPSWPGGTSEILSHASRVYSVGGNGDERTYFHSTPEQTAELIKAYSDMQLREHLLFVKRSASRKDVKTFGGVKVEHNAQFQLFDGFARFRMRQEGKAETHEPTLTIYVDPAKPDDLVQLKKISVRDHVIVESEFEDWPKSKATREARRNWHATVQFRDGGPAVDFEGGVQTTVTLWERDWKRGIQLGQLSNKGKFRAAFSEREIEALKAKTAWLTLTVGNYLKKANRDQDPILPWQNLALDEAEAPPVKVGKPRYYFGRLLFRDGTPAILDREIWRGAEISVSFPYAGGLMRPDEDGYFKVTFTPEQLEALKKRKVRPNVYIPDLEKPNQSRALYVFPVEILSPDKESAGELRIDHPEAERPAT